MPQIVKATHKDLPRIATCHRAAFANTLSSAMGQQYVEKMLEWYLVDDRAFLFYVQEDNVCVGYCGGMKFDGRTGVGSASSMIQYSFNSAIKAMLLRPWLFFSPELILRYRLAFRNLWRRLVRKWPPAAKPVEKRPDLSLAHVGLVVIGVHPGYQGKGYGSLLLKEFDIIAKKLGFSKVNLTVKSKNRKAIAAYQSNNWVILNDDGKSVVMSKAI